MLQLCAYEWDHPGVGTDICLLHPDNAAMLGAQHVSLRKQDTKEDVVVTLTINARTNVAIHDIVLHPCVYSALALCKGEIVLLSSVSAPTAAAQVQLQFDSFQSLVHWDHIPLIAGLFYLPNVWYQCWPEGLKPHLVEMGCELVLLGTVLCNGAIVTVRYLDYILCFKVIIEGEGQQPVIGNAQTKYTINVFPSTSPTTAADTQPLKPKPTCFQPTLSNITTLFQAIFMPGETRGLFSRSLIISAPVGGGKSSFLQGAADWLRAQYPSSSIHRGPHIKILSCDGIGKHSTADLDESALGMGMGTESAGRGLITNVLRLLGADWPVTEQSGWDFTIDGLVLVLDDLDSVFDQYSASRDDLTADPRTDPQRVLGYHLSRLLSWLATAANPGRVLVLGATTRPPAQLLRAHTGCPEFERCLVLGSPTVSERAEVLAYLLAESGLPFDAFDASTVAEEVGAGDAVVSAKEVVGVWAERLAGITAGYLPGDLRAVVQRISLLHDGEQAARNLRGDRTTTGSTGDVYICRVAWGTALEAVVSVVPKQLQELGIGAGGSGGRGGPRAGAAGGRLSWSDFAGYPDILADLQRRLKSSAVEATPPVVSSSSAVRPLQKMPLRGLVVHGPTGCGKTLLASVVAAEAKMNLVAVKSTELLSKYFGETEGTIRNLFQKARAAAPCVLFFDDFDTLAHKRSAADAEDGATSNGLHGRILSTFLNELDGILGTGDGVGVGNGDAAVDSTARTEGCRVLVIVACQDISSLDEALVRPGRLQHHVYLRQPTVQDVAAIVELYMGKLNRAAEVSTARAAAVLAAVGASASEAESFVTAVYTTALREAVAEVEDPTVSEAERRARYTRPRQIEQRHVDAALRDLLLRHELSWEDVEEALVEDVARPNSGAAGASAFTVPGISGGEGGFQWSGGFSAGV